MSWTKLSRCPFSEPIQKLTGWSLHLSSFFRDVFLDLFPLVVKPIPRKWLSKVPLRPKTFNSGHHWGDVPDKPQYFTRQPG